MAKRRGNQEGSIYQKANGMWRAQMMLNGGRLSITVATRIEAQDWLRKTRNQIENGLTYKGATTSFEQFLDEWLIAAKSRLTEHSWRDYAQVIRDHIKPTLGKVRLRDLSAARIQRLYDQRIAEGLGLRTVYKLHSVIHASLNAAMKLGLLGRNPDDVTLPPKLVRKEMRFLTAPQVKKLLETAKKTEDRNYALYYLAIATGMREGELLALRWDDVNPEKGLLNVKLSLKRFPGGGLKLSQPKTKTSVRTIKLGGEAIEVLRIQRLRIDQDKAVSGSLWQDLNFVFPSPVGTPIDPSNLIKSFRKLLRLSELPPIRFHDLRHTAASLMLNNGVDVLIASKRLGHANPSITLDTYSHLIPSMQTHAAQALEGLLSEE